MQHANPTQLFGAPLTVDTVQQHLLQTSVPLPPARRAGAAKRIRSESDAENIVSFCPPQKQPIGSATLQNPPSFCSIGSFEGAVAGFGNANGTFLNTNIPANRGSGLSIGDFSPSPMARNAFDGLGRLSGGSWGSMTEEAFGAWTPTGGSMTPRFRSNASTPRCALPKQQEPACTITYQKTQPFRPQLPQQLHQQQPNQNSSKLQVTMNQSQSQPQDPAIMKFMFDPNFQSLPEQAKKIVLERIKKENAATCLMSLKKSSTDASQQTPAKQRPKSVEGPNVNAQQLRPRRYTVSAANTVLPDGWTRHFDKRRGRIYYHHKLARKTTWTHPRALMMHTSVDNPHAVLGSPRSKQRYQ